ncbi:CYTH and CHAD domain-containing protein [Arthrobacter sp. ov118]|jgi:CHAD domain-containing protein|uniref:CYTH and CHAD domain-containing protein n=1 Tax=Arthrobacter sp. ov118 TaxID=1761747 RepID=UPI0008EDABE2|nr:CYTH and CHAD domain-containing protein [Arthrobacter sp. ov118]SFT88089.1 CHAD domain-containing protein [Arthrobacter sp. ov118]
MDAAQSVETERKFDVARPELSPPLQNLRGVNRVDEPVEHLLEAQYFDSSDLTLARHRITLRRRSGGEDDGWHLKLPLDDADSRRELQEPLGTGDSPPEALVRQIRVHLRGRKLVPVVRLSTRRVVHRLRGADDKVLAEIADDHVHAEPLLPGRAGHDWREWEVELVAGGPDLLDAVQDKFAAAGVHRAGHASKLARALGSLHPEPATPPDRTGSGTAGRMLRAYVNEQVQALQEQDPQVRDRVPDAVHQMRVATRRLRSALATQRRLLEPEPAAALRAELRWLAGVLGEVRDTEVMQERLLELLATEPPELVMGPVARRINEELSAAYSDHYRTLLETMDQERYFRLLDSLDEFRKDPPLTAKADKKPKSASAAIGKDGKRLRKAVKAARSNRGTPHGDESLHEARKAAKRLRYAAEAAAAVDAKQAGQLEQAAHSIQKVLGRHQDSVVAREVLRRLAGEAFLQGENAFSYGRLHALEQNLAAETETDFYDSWTTFPAKLLK